MATTAEQSMAPANDTNGHARQLGPLRMLDDMARFFGPGFRFPMMPLPRRGALVALPRTDVAEKDHTLIITAELPGVKKEDLQVELQDGALVIRAETHVSEHEGRGLRPHGAELRQLLPSPASTVRGQSRAGAGKPQQWTARDSHS
jgi:HSP20 family molecular chaperone IbpA